MTQRELATKIPCSWSHIKRVERGVTNPSAKARAAFAAALDTDPVALFADFPAAREEREAATINARRAHVERDYTELTMPELAAQHEVSTTTIWKDVHALGLEARPAHTRAKYAPANRLCQRCGKPLPFRHPSDHANLRGVYHRECYEDGGVVNKCPICGRERYRPRSHARKKCCGYKHAARYRWEVSRAGLWRFVDSRREGQGSWSGDKRRLWKLRLTRSPGRRRNDARPDYEEALARIRDAYEETHAPERDLARETGESRRMVRIALGRPV
jgi:transcriptional regulator with XRE-family HTH domain